MAPSTEAAGVSPCPSHSIYLRSANNSCSSSEFGSSSSLIDVGSDTSSVSTHSSSSCTDALQQRQKHYGPNIALSYSQPLLIERGEGCYLFDEQGRRYLDCVNNVAHVGHGNMQVAAAISAQLCRVNTNSRYLSSELNAYCEELTDTLPAPLKVVYLVNSGSEANDLALRIASAAAAAAAAAAGTNPTATQADGSSSSSSSSKRDHVVVMAGAYHGHLSSLIPLSPYKFWGPGGSGKPDWVHVMPAPDMCRSLNLDGAAAARAVLAQAAATGGRVVAFFCESIISCGGQLLLPPGYLQSVYKVMHAAGVVCIADEVQTGFGRTGRMWAFEEQGVVPDIVTMGKPMGNGFPIGGVVTSPNLAARFANGMEYFNTYGGNNAAVAAGRAVLQEMRDNSLQQHAAAVGRYMFTQLKQLQQQFPTLICDVRGVGLFIGLELVSCPTTKSPAPLAAKTLKEGAKARGVLLTTDGPVGHVVKIKPPMVFGVAEVDTMVEVMRDVLLEMTAPQAWQELMAVEQTHYAEHAAPILARYAANEQQVWATAAAAAADQIGAALEGVALTATAAASVSIAAAEVVSGSATAIAAAAAATVVPAAAAAAAAVAAKPSSSSASLAEADCSIMLLPSDSTTSPGVGPQDTVKVAQA